MTLRMGIAHSVSVVSSVRVGNMHFIEIQFATFIPAASLRVQLKGDHLKGMKGSLFSENKNTKKMPEVLYVQEQHFSFNPEYHITYL